MSPARHECDIPTFVRTCRLAAAFTAAILSSEATAAAAPVSRPAVQSCWAAYFGCCVPPESRNSGNPEVLRRNAGIAGICRILRVSVHTHRVHTCVRVRRGMQNARALFRSLKSEICNLPRAAVCQDSCGRCLPESRNSGDSGSACRSPESGFGNPVCLPFVSPHLSGC